MHCGPSRRSERFVVRRRLPGVTLIVSDSALKSHIAGIVMRRGLQLTAAKKINTGLEAVVILFALFKIRGWAVDR